MSLYPLGNRFYDEDEVELICEMLDRGYPHAQIVDALVDFWEGYYSPRNKGHLRQKCLGHVQQVAADRWSWSTFRDPVAMELAYMGQRDEWENLTYYERREVVLRMQRLLDADTPHPAFPGVPINTGGLAQWAEQVGCNPNNITSPFGRRAR